MTQNTALAMGTVAAKLLHFITFKRDTTKCLEIVIFQHLIVTIDTYMKYK